MESLARVYFLHSAGKGNQQLPINGWSYVVYLLGCFRGAVAGDASALSVF